MNTYLVDTNILIYYPAGSLVPEEKPAIDRVPGSREMPPEFLQVLQRIGDAMAPIKTRDQQTFPVRIEGDTILADI
jgi:hypothetical protein